MSDVFKKNSASSIGETHIEDMLTASVVPNTPAESCQVVGEFAVHCADTTEPLGGIDGEGKISEADVGGISCRRFDEMIREAQLGKIEAVEDRSDRADLIARFALPGACERSRKLILSVEGASVMGCAVQALLNGPIRTAPAALAPLVREVHSQLEAAYPAHRRRRSRPAADRQSLYTSLTKLAEELCTQASGKLNSEAA
ncbi:hypothetical protein [Methylobacterium sp. V23]|uniref:hypothetical protein n=1 Tax=Methylobacterium sp. V23 TaxID=2044878 RepID=UPI0011B00AD0|nr:hypothetical protein [Methylobacterium sp. V23]